MTNPEAQDVVRTLRRGQERAAADAIAAGHANYPSFRQFFPNDELRAKILPTFFHATVRDAVPFGSVLSAWTGDRVDAVAVWLPPGRFPWTPMRKLRATPAFLRIMAAAPRAFKPFVRFGARVEAAHRDAPHWYLVVMSVRPERQRQGLGKALVKPILERADRDGVDCRLETADPTNIPFYQGLGFNVVDAAFVPIPRGPSLTTFHRSPATTITR
ncbi:MAG: GNAT family N-acetyltransferase [Gammaproteobacteria bacterium]